MVWPIKEHPFFRYRRHALARLGLIERVDATFEDLSASRDVLQWLSQGLSSATVDSRDTHEAWLSRYPHPLSDAYRLEQALWHHAGKTIDDLVQLCLVPEAYRRHARSLVVPIEDLRHTTVSTFSFLALPSDPYAVQRLAEVRERSLQYLPATDPAS